MDKFKYFDPLTQLKPFTNELVGLSFNFFFLEKPIRSNLIELDHKLG